MTTIGIAAAEVSSWLQVLAVYITTLGSLLAALAWPVALIGLALIFRSDIQRLLPKIARFKAGAFEAELIGEAIAAMKPLTPESTGAPAPIVAPDPATEPPRDGPDQPGRVDISEPSSMGNETAAELASPDEAADTETPATGSIASEAGSAVGPRPRQSVAPEVLPSDPARAAAPVRNQDPSARITLPKVAARAFNKARSVAPHSPRAAILMAWRGIELAMERALASTGESEMLDNLPAIATLAVMGLLDSEALQRIFELKEIRDTVASLESFYILPKDPLLYVDRAEEVAISLSFRTSLRIAAEARARRKGSLEEPAPK